MKEKSWHPMTKLTPFASFPKGIFLTVRLPRDSNFMLMNGGVKDRSWLSMTKLPLEISFPKRADSFHRTIASRWGGDMDEGWGERGIMTLDD